VTPPGCVLEHHWWKDSLSSSLIAIVDMCHMVLAHQVISFFGTLGAGTCVGLRGSVGIGEHCGADTTHDPGSVALMMHILMRLCVLL